MAHYNLYKSLGLDRGKNTHVLGAEIDARLASDGLDPALRDELEVARRVLGDAQRRSAYDTKLDDPSAPPIDVAALRDLARAEFGSHASASAGAAASGPAIRHGSYAQQAPEVEQEPVTEQPVAEREPEAQEDPAEASEPSEPSEPSESSEPSEPWETAEPSEPLEPVDPQTEVVSEVKPPMSPEAAALEALAAPAPDTRDTRDTRDTPERDAKASRRNKPKQYFPETDPNLEAVEAGAAGPAGHAGPVGPGGAPYPQSGQIPGQAPPQGYPYPQGYYPPPPGYYPPGYYPAPEPEKKKRVSVPLILAIALVLAGIGAGGWWLWDNHGTAYSPEAQAVAEAFPAILPEQSGQRGFDNMKCREVEAENGQEARIRCSNRTLGLSVIDYGSESVRDSTLPGKDPDIIGNEKCSARSFRMDGVTPPAFKIAPEGEDARYLLVINGDTADERKMYLNFCD